MRHECVRNVSDLSHTDGRGTASNHRAKPVTCTSPLEPFRWIFSHRSVKTSPGRIPVQHHKKLKRDRLDRHKKA